MRRTLTHIRTSSQVLTLTAVMLVPAFAHAQDITSNLIGHWTFEDTDGDTTTDDATGNGFDGTLTNMDPSTDFVQGVFGQGISFDGTNDGVAVPDLGVNTNTITFSGWIRANSFANTPGFIFDRDPPGSFAEGLWSDPSGNLRYTWADDFPGSTLTMNTGEWNFIAMTVSAVDIIVYKGTRDTGLQSQTFSNGYAAQTLNDLWIGEDPTSSRFFNGLMDDVRIYDRTLTPADIQALFEAPWESCELQNRGAIIYNNTENVMQYCDSSNWIAMGKKPYVPNAVTFDGTNDYLYQASTNHNDTKLVTVSFWVKRTKDDGSWDWIYDENDPGPSNGFQIISNGGPTADDNAARIMFRAQNDAGTDILNIATSDMDTGWHHVMASFDLSDIAKRHVYVDGVSDLATITTWTDDIIERSPVAVNIAANSSSVVEFGGDIADLWIDFGTYIDLSDADNRAKFIDASGNPVDLGNSGVGPTGQAPDLFLSGDTVNWHTNKGTGGGFTENGALTQATSPTDSRSWAQIGNDSALIGGVESGLAAMTENRVAYFNDTIGNLQTYDFDGTNWTAVGNPLAVTDLNNAQMESLNASTVVIATSVGAGSLRTFEFDGTDWTQVGNTYVGGGSNIAVLTENSVASGGSNNIRKFTWDGTDWTPVGSSFNDGAGPFTRGDFTALDINRIATVGQTGFLSAYDFDGTNWTLVGNSYTIPATRSGITALSSNIVAVGQGNNLQTYRFDGTNWYPIGQAYDPGGGQPFLTTLGSHKIAHTAGGTDVIKALGFAFCTNPDSPPGSITYNTTTNQMQFCNGFEHVAMGPTGNGGAGCSNPSGAAGDITFNTSFNRMQYCEGDEWIGIGNSGVNTALSSGLIGHWRFDETSGTTANDSSGNGNTGTLDDGLNASTDSVAGIANTAFNFDGADDFVRIPDFLGNNSAVTFSGWFNTTDWSNGGNAFTVLIGQTKDTGSLGNVGLTYRNDTQRAYFHFRNASDVSIESPTSSQPPSNTWVHLAGTYDGTSLKMYMNGAEEGSVAHNGTLFDGNNIISIGKKWEGGVYPAGTDAWPFNGAIDDVRIYDRALSAGEILALYDLADCPNVGETCDDGSIYAGQFSGNKLFVRSTDNSGPVPFNNANSSGYTATTASSSTDGEANTTALVGTDSDSITAGTQLHQAAQICASSTALGHSDWYLPARNELDVIYSNRVAIGGFTTVGPGPNDYYFSSTTTSSDRAWRRAFSTGGYFNDQKQFNARVRCVRKN